MSYGCFNHQPLKATAVVADGWYMDGHTRSPRMISIADPMTKTCQYSRDDRYADLGCIGCAHKSKALEAQTVS